MGTINTQFFKDLANKATWAAGVAFQRSNALPLDKYSVFESYAKAEEYVNSNPVAYPGQVIAAYDETSKEMMVYVLAEIETGTAVDETTGEEVATYGLTLQEIGGKIDLDGTSLSFNENTGLLEISGFKGAATATLPQKKIAEDGTESIEWVTIDAIVEGDGNTTYTVTPLKRNVGTEEESVEEIYGFMLTPSEGAATEIALDVYTKTEIDKALELKANATDVYTKTETDTAIDNAVKGILGEDVSEAYDTLVEIQKLMESDDTASAELVAKVNANETAIATLNGDSETEGSVDKKIADAIAEENLDQYAKATDIADTYVTKAVATAENGVRFINQDEIDILGNLNLGDDGKVEISGQVNANNVLGLYDKISSIITSSNDELDLDPNTDGVQAGLGIEAGAQVNKIEKIVFNGTEATVANKTATIAGEYYTKDETDAKVKTASDAAGAAQATADEAKSQANTNKTNLESLQDEVNEHYNILQVVQTHVTNYETKVNALEETVATHSGSIATLTQDVATALSTANANNQTIGALVAKDTEHDNAIAALQSGKVNTADVYTKGEVYTKEQTNSAIMAITGTPTADKTIVQMIEDAQAAATYDDTQVKADIKANADALKLLNGYVDEENAGDTGKTIREIAADEINTIIGGVSDADTIENIADLIKYVNDNGAEVVGIKTDIQTNTANIAKNSEAIVALQQIGIATESVAGFVKSSASTVENSIAVDADTGTMTVNSLNVNKLTQTEGDVLVLNGGTASKTI